MQMAKIGARDAIEPGGRKAFTVNVCYQKSRLVQPYECRKAKAGADDWIIQSCTLAPIATFRVFAKQSVTFARPLR